VLLFSVNLVKEKTGKKASPTTRPNSWTTRQTTRIPKESLTPLIIANGNETGLFLSLLPLSVCHDCCFDRFPSKLFCRQIPTKAISDLCERRVENDRFLLTLLVKLLRHLIDLGRVIPIQELLGLQARLDVLKRNVICPYSLPLQSETDHHIHMRISSGSV
jgi:hypothetical protein